MRRSLANRSTDGASGTSSRASRVSWARVSSSSSRSIRCIADWTKKQIPGQERAPLIYEDLRAPAPAAALTWKINRQWRDRVFHIAGWARRRQRRRERNVSGIARGSKSSISKTYEIDRQVAALEACGGCYTPML